MDSRKKEIITQNIPLIEEVIKKFSSYHGANIDLQRTICFLTQFENHEQIKFIIKLIQNIDFIDSSKMTYLLNKAYYKIPENLRKNALISSLGSIQDSSAVICYHLLKEIFHDEKNALNSIADVNTLGKLLEERKPSSIIFFDDNITSGTQLSEFFEELIEGKDYSEMVKTPLSNKQVNLLKNIPIRICYAIQLAEESNSVIELLKSKYNLDIRICCGKVDYDNYLSYSSKTIDSLEEEKFAQNMISSIAQSLYMDKDWSPNTIYQRLLGYGNLGKLTVFYYNIPKSLIPVFWKSGIYNDKHWIPLFPEAQEKKKMKENSITFNEFQLELVKTWIESAPSNRKVNIDFGFKQDGKLVKSIKIEIPSVTAIKNFIRNKKIADEITYETESPKKPMLPSVSVFYDINNTPKSTLNYDKYKSAVDEYNEEVMDYKHLVEDYIIKKSSNSNVNFFVENTGNKTATNCTVKIFYNTGEILFNYFDGLVKPKFEKEKPKLDNYYTNKVRVINSLGSFVSISSILKSDNNKIKPLKLNTDYQFKIFNSTNINKNDDQENETIVTRMNDDIKYLKFNYELNYEEESEAIYGVLEIYFIEVEEINTELQKSIINTLNKFEIV